MRSHPFLKMIQQFLFLSGVLFLWYVVVRLKIWPEYLLPSPLSVGESLWSGFQDWSFPLATLVSLKRLFLGFGLAIVIGTLLGMSLSFSSFLKNTLGGLILGLQSLPSVCWLPLSILWFGLSEGAIVFVVFLGALFPITLSVEAGIKRVPKIFIKAGKNMGAKGWKLFWFVVRPAAVPSILVGMRQAWSFAWRSLLAGELVFVNLGLGQLMMMGRELNDLSQVMAVMILITTIGIFMEQIVFAKVEKNLFY